MVETVLVPVKSSAVDVLLRGRRLLNDARVLRAALNAAMLRSRAALRKKPWAVRGSSDSVDGNLRSEIRQLIQDGHLPPRGWRCGRGPEAGASAPCAPS